METERRLIDANELLKVLKHRVKGNEDSGIVFGTNSTLEIMEEWVRSIPTVDAVEVVHGRWKHQYEKGMSYKVCTICGCRNGLELKFNYCPNCGAKMDGERRTE